MKKTFALGLLALIASGANAQQINTPPTLKEVAQQVRNLNANHTAPVAKPTAVKQRLIKSTAWSGTSLKDTTDYIYDFGRGSEFDFEDMDYHDGIVYPNTKGTKMVMYDSIRKISTTNGSLHSSAAYIGNVRVSQVSYYPIYSTRMTWMIGSQGSITEMMAETYNNSTMAWMADYRNRYIYDAAGRLVTESVELYFLGNWIPAEDKTYNYNAANQIDTAVYSEYTGGQWVLKRRYCFAYTSGQMTYMLHQVHNGTSWEDLEKVNAGYAGSQKITEKKERWVTGSWVLQSDEYRHLDGNGLPDSIFRHGTTGPGWDTVITRVVYNTFGNPETMDYYTGNMFHLTHRQFTYEDYDPQGVKEIAAAKSLRVFPNPAKEQLYIATGDLKQGDIDYAISNSLGQTVMDGKEVARGDKMSMDIRRLSPGMYWLRIQDAGGMRYQASFVVE